MKLKKNKLFFITMLMMIFCCFQAFAGNSQIKSVTVGFTETKEDPGIIREATPSLKASHCILDEWTCSHPYEEWNAGSKITFNLTIKPSDGYVFSKDDTKVKLSGKNAELVKSTVGKSKITMKINYWPSMTLGEPENLTWDEDDDWTAVWDKVEDCNLYEVKIYITDANDKVKTQTVTTKKPKIDLSDYTTNGEVTFSVRAVAKDDKQKKYFSASDWVAMDDSIAPSYENTVVGSFKGNDENRTFINSDGNTVSGWQLINDVWYYFEPDNKNKMASNKWLQINGEWYYFASNGMMETGWTKIEDYWYYFNPNSSDGVYGAMKTGWILIGPSSPQYYMNDGSIPNIPVGANLRDAVTPDGYYVDSEGACYNYGTAQNNVSGWLLKDGTWYYYIPEAGNAMAKNQWCYINNNWYYFGADGIMKTSWQEINGQWYYLKEDVNASDYGAMVKGWVCVDPTNGPWYYLNEYQNEQYPEGACLRNTVTPDGYTVGNSGAWVH